MNTKNRSEGHSILQMSTVNQTNVFRVCSFLQVFGFVTIIVQFLIPFLILSYCYTKIALVLHKRVVKVRITLNSRLLHAEINHCTLHEHLRILTNRERHRHTILQLKHFGTFFYWTEKDFLFDNFTASCLVFALFANAINKTIAVKLSKSDTCHKCVAYLHLKFKITVNMLCLVSNQMPRSNGDKYEAKIAKLLELIHTKNEPHTPTFNCTLLL